MTEGKITPRNNHDYEPGWIAAARKKMKLSTRQMSEELGFSRRSLMLIEKGEREVPKYLGMAVELLLLKRKAAA